MPKEVRAGESGRANPRFLNGGGNAMPVGDVRFFARSGSHDLAAVALAAEGSAPPAALILTGVAPLTTAGPTEEFSR